MNIFFPFVAVVIKVFNYLCILGILLMKEALLNAPPPPNPEKNGASPRKGKSCIGKIGHTV